MAPAGTVLLTGANGFLASHILAGLIERNYHVVGTVRSSKKAEEILNLHPDWNAHTTFAFIADIGAPNAYDEVFKTYGPFDYVINAASPVDFTVTDLQGDMIDPAIRGTVAVLEAANKLGGPTLKRFVLTGSSVNIANFFQPVEKARAKPWSEEDWNEVTAEWAVENHNLNAAYSASKKLAEEAAWKFMADNKPSWDLTVLNPHVIIGPMINAVAGPGSVGMTNVFPVYGFLNGMYKSIEGLLFPAWHHVDVRDVALAHVLSLTTPLASNKRILLVGDLMTPQIVINIIRKNFPELHDRIIEGNPEKLIPDGIDPTGWDVSRSKEVFGKEWKYASVEDSVVDTVKSLIEWEGKWATNPIQAGGKIRGTFS